MALESFVYNHIYCLSLFISIVMIAFISFIWMLNKRKGVYKELETLKIDLENRVEDRTRELKISNEQLQDEVLKRKHAQEILRQAKEDAESANRAKSEYLANLSHELRTPLNVILGFSELLERSSDATKEQCEHLRIINRSGEHLLALINDVLEMSKIEAGQIRLNPTSFNLHDSIRGIEEMIRRRAQEKGLIFLVDIKDAPKYIKTDESKFRQILINLLNNAIKFTHSGSIQLRVSYNQLRSKELDIEIEDTGIGIPNKDMLSIFDSFSRLSHDRYGIEGTGLGLSISQKLIVLLGGNISIDSQYQCGSLVRFSITFEEANQNVSELHHQGNMLISVDKNWQHIQILVVEDKWENRLLLKHLLLQVGLKVIEAPNGQKAIEQYLRYRPALIFMDIRMPLMSGIEATKRIRKLPQGKKVKIIAITAHAFQEYKEDILAVGCDDLIRKPYRKSDIFDSIKKHVGVTFYTDKKLYDHYEIIEDLKPDDLRVLPKEIICKLKQASVDLDVKDFKSVIEDIYPKHPQIASTLQKLSNEFRYDQVLVCLKQLSV